MCRKDRRAPKPDLPLEEGPAQDPIETSRDRSPVVIRSVTNQGSGHFIDVLDYHNALTQWGLQTRSEQQREVLFALADDIRLNFPQVFDPPAQSTKEA